MTWHQFRHTHWSLLNDLRVPVKIAQEQLGHASISTTLNIYTSSTPRIARRSNSSNGSCSQLFPHRPNRPIRENQKALKGQELKKRPRPQASAGGKS